jgi:hypothetical protein
MATADLGHKLADQELAKLEQRISQAYGDAAAELSETIGAYFESLRQRDEEMKKMLQRGEITKAHYNQWRLNQIGRGERYKQLRDKIAERMTDATETATSYINDVTPGIYSLNRNWTAYEIEKVAGNADFTLWNEQAVKRLIKDNPDMLLYYPGDIAIKYGDHIKWIRECVGKAITSAILQGKSITKIANELQQKIPGLNRRFAIGTARTAITNAQNAGRQDQYLLAKQMGIKVRKRWFATLDGRTRHAHAMADGQTVDVDADFDVDGYKMAYPGDRRAPGYLLYNCRCTMRTVEPEGIEAESRQRVAKDPETGRNILISDMTYQEWLRWKEGQ